ncbi:MAG: flavodoxin domain-containing protein [Bacillota bacterium]|nr:flavodoxin domain-containing protein [Bacillota bacterium]
MNTIILYSGKSGTTQKAAQILKELLPNAVSLDLKKASGDIGQYDTVIIGGAIRIGKLPKEVDKFIAANKDALLKKHLGLFICCGFTDKAQEELNAVYSQELRDHAAALGCFGGEINIDKQKGIDKLIAKAAVKQGEKDGTFNIPKLDVNAIQDFAATISKDS